jgi:hypothetical protein
MELMVNEHIRSGRREGRVRAPKWNQLAIRLCTTIEHVVYKIGARCGATATPSVEPPALHDFLLRRDFYQPDE